MRKPGILVTFEETSFLTELSDKYKNSRTICRKFQLIVIREIKLIFAKNKTQRLYLYKGFEEKCNL